MSGAFQWTDELKTPSRDRVSISPRSCADFVWCAQAEIVCRFHQVIDWGSLEIGSDFGKNLRRGGELLERENIAKEVDMDSRGVVEVIAKEVDDERRRKQQQKIAAAAGNRLVGRPVRSTGPVDRRAQHAQGQRAVDRPVDRHCLTVNAQLSVGHPVRSTGRRERSTVRSTASSDCKYPTLCWAPGRPTGRPVEEVGRPSGRPTVGCG